MTFGANWAQVPKPRKTGPWLWLNLNLLLLGGSWVVISRVIVSPLMWVIAIVTLLITPLISTLKPTC